MKKLVIIIAFLIQDVFSNGTCCYETHARDYNSNFNCSCEGEDLDLVTLSDFNIIPTNPVPTHEKYYYDLSSLNLNHSDYKKYKNRTVAYYPDQTRNAFPTVVYFCDETNMRTYSKDEIFVNCSQSDVINNESYCLPGLVWLQTHNYDSGIYYCHMYLEQESAENIDLMNLYYDGYNNSLIYTFIRNDYPCIDCEDIGDKQDFVILESERPYNKSADQSAVMTFREKYSCRRNDDSIPSSQFTCARSRSYDPIKYGGWYQILNALSIFFHGITLIAFLILSEIRTMKLKILICQIFSFLILNITELRLYATGVDLETIECILSAYMRQFWDLMGSFWINVLCIDMAWTFSGKHSHCGNKRKFLYYSLYAWGGSTIISVITAVLEFTDKLPRSMLLPRISYFQCTLKTLPMLIAYYNGPIIALSIINGPLLLYTVYKLTQAFRASKLLDANGSSRHVGKKRNARSFIVYTNLGLMIGAPRILSFIKLLTEDEAIFLAVNATIMSRSFFLFLFICCRRKVGTLLKKRALNWHFKLTYLFRTGCWQEEQEVIGSQRDSIQTNTESLSL